MVIFAHSSEQFLESSQNTLNILHNIGWCGVDLFFVISGFIMMYTTESRPHHPTFPGWDFFRRRLARVVPLYWVVTFVVAIIALLLPNLLKTTRFSFSYLITSLLFLPFRDPQSGSISPLLHLGWTLNFEMLFYVCFALALSIVRPWWRIGVLGGGFLLLIALGNWLPSGPPLFAPIHFWGEWVTMEFLAGCALGTLFLRGHLHRLDPRLGWVLFAAGLILLMGFAIEHGEANLNTRTLWKGLPSLLIILSVLIIERKYQFTNNRLRQLGDATYSLYLTHLFVVMGFRRLWLEAHLPTSEQYIFLFALGCMIVAVPLGVFVHEFRFGEKWMISRAKKLVKRWPPPSMWFSSAKPDSGI